MNPSQKPPTRTPYALNLEIKASIGDIVVFQHLGSRKMYRGEILEISLFIGVYTERTGSPASIGQQFVRVTYKVSCGPRDTFATKDRIKLVAESRIREVYPNTSK